LLNTTYSLKPIMFQQFCRKS